MNNTYVIAEIGINHNGSMFYAKKLIDQAFESKCHAVKFQKRDIESVYSQEELERYRESPWGCLLYTSPSPRDRTRSRMPSSA